MKTTVFLSLTAAALLLAGSLTACSTVRAAEAAPPVTAAAADRGETAEETSRAAQFALYAPFGLAYDAETDTLTYDGEPVRWFEDYYPVGDGLRAGRDYFDEDGTVDVRAVRDLEDPPRAADGSFDPAGELVGVEAFSAAEFAARDVEALKNPPAPAAVAGDPPTADALRAIAAEYAPFGLTCDAERGCWYWNGEKVRHFRDVLTSNGESLTGGNFQGTLRTFGSEDGTVDLCTVRDYAAPNEEGNGTLTAIEACSPEEFDARTRADLCEHD